MTTHLPIASQDAACDAVVDRTDLGTAETEGKIRVYSGSQPTSANDAPTGTLLAEVDLDNPAFGDSGAVTDGVASLLGVPLSAAGITDGVAGWFRIVNRDLATVVDGEVGTTDAEMIVNTTSVGTGVTFEILSLTVTMPSGEA
jgi:hypothetical protein